MYHSHVIKTTLQQLQKTLNEFDHEAPEDISWFHEGARDWVVVIRHEAKSCVGGFAPTEHSSTSAVLPPVPAPVSLGEWVVRSGEGYDTQNRVEWVGDNSSLENTSFTCIELPLDEAGRNVAAHLVNILNHVNGVDGNPQNIGTWLNVVAWSLYRAMTADEKKPWLVRQAVAPLWNTP